MGAWPWPRRPTSASLNQVKKHLGHDPLLQGRGRSLTCRSAFHPDRTFSGPGLIVTRKEAIRSLVAFDRPLGELRERVASFPFDWDGPPVGTLRREHLLAVLARWQSGELTPKEVEDWANLVEARDDLDVDSTDPAVADAVFDPANPLMQGQLHDVGPALAAALCA